MQVHGENTEENRVENDQNPAQNGGCMWRKKTEPSLNTRKIRSSLPRQCDRIPRDRCGDPPWIAHARQASSELPRQAARRPCVPCMGGRQRLARGPARVCTCSCMQDRLRRMTLRQLAPAVQVQPHSRLQSLGSDLLRKATNQVHLQDLLRQPDQFNPKNKNMSNLNLPHQEL